MRSAVTRAAALACAGMVAGVLGGCTLITDSFLTNDFSGDPFPINVDTTSGAILVGLRQAGADDRVAVLDLLSPITVVDQKPATDPSLSYIDLTLLGAAAPGGPLDLSTAVPRARFPEAQLVALHPCTNECDPSDPSCDPNQCNVGTAVGPHEFQAIIGADALAGDAVRLRLSDGHIFVLPDVGGSDRGRSLDCDAVFDSPYRGGGTLVFPTTELAFGNRRITLRACLGPDPDPDPQLAVTDPDLAFDPKPNGTCAREGSRQMIANALLQHGTDALLVVSTSIGITILGATAYQRYALAHPGAPTLDMLAPDTVYLPSEVVHGWRATIDRVALVAAPSTNALAPCRQLYAHRLLSALGPIDSSEFDTCTEGGATMDARQYRFDTPCKDSSAFCPIPAILELAQPSGVDVLVVDDTDPTLQALRAELRPDQPEVDGILGTNVLGATAVGAAGAGGPSGAEIDVDYPHDRLLARCPGSYCSARPQLAQPDDRCQINRCIKGLQDFRNQAPTGQSPDDRNLPGCPLTPPS